LLFLKFLFKIFYSKKNFLLKKSDDENQCMSMRII
jgi:hypothetical protein